MNYVLQVFRPSPATWGRLCGGYAMQQIGLMNMYDEIIIKLNG